MKEKEEDVNKGEEETERRGELGEDAEVRKVNEEGGQ